MASANHPDHPWPLPQGTPAIEVWYALVGPRDGRFAFWYRYTLLATAGGLEEARVWAALTDRAQPARSFLVTRRLPLAAARFGSGAFALDVGDAGHLDDGHATGQLEAPFGQVAWALDWTPDTEPFTPIGSPALTEVAVRLLGAGRHRSVNEAVLATGRVEVDGEVLELDRAPAHQGHTSGRVLNDAWSWVQCNAFDDETVALEALHLKGMTTVCLKTAGRVHRLNRVRDLFGPRKSRSTSEVGRWHLEAAGDGVKVAATITADPALWQRAAYLSPDGTLRYNAHCSLARVELEVREATRPGQWSAPAKHRSEAGRVEWVGRRPKVPGRYFPDVWEAEVTGARHGSPP